MPKRYVRGDRAFGRLVKQLPDDVAQELREQLNVTGRMLLARAAGRAPVYAGKPRKGLVPGALRSGLSYNVPPVRLQLKVGIVGASANRKLFYGRFVEFGHRIGSKGNRLPKLEKISSRFGSVRYRLESLRRRRDVRLNGVAPRPFLYTVTRAEIYAPFRDIWSRALRKAAAGAGASD